MDEQGAQDNTIQTLSMTAQGQQQSLAVKNCKEQKVTILFAILGFYFLIFAIIELLNNHEETFYELFFQCSATLCSINTKQITFPQGNSVSIYLQNQFLSQQDFSFNKQLSTSQNTFLSNLEMDKKISLEGTELAPKNQAFPQGEFTSLYPEGTLKITNKQSLQEIKLTITDLSFESSSEQNTNNRSSQWADVQSQRYAVWSEKQISLGLKKYWGVIPISLSGNYTIQLQTINQMNSKFSKNLSLLLTDGKSLDGHNLSFCTINFCFAFFVFVLSCLSFSFDFGKRQENIRTAKCCFSEQIASYNQQS